MTGKRPGGRARAKERAKRHQLAVGGARDLDVSHSPGDVGDASSTPDDAAKNGCTVVLSPGETGIAFHWPLRNAPSGELERLEQLMARPPSWRRRPPPKVDEQLTGLLQPMPAIDLLAVIDQIFSDERLAAASETDRRSFDRTRAVITAIAARPASAGWRTTLYVRGSEPPRQAFVLHPPRLLVVALKAGRLYFVMAVGPRGKTAHESKEAEALELELLSLMRWQMQHMPVLERKGAIHIGMPGVFHVLGLHMSQHGEAHNEVERFGPSRCRCTGADRCDREADWQAATTRARKISLDFESVLKSELPTEHARQAALPEQLLEPYAAVRKMVEENMLGAQHGLCQSAGNKTSADHGDGGNHGQFNYLVFSAPTLVRRLLKENPKVDLGLWEQEGGELVVPLSPRLEIIFNSEEGHACLANANLLPCCNAPEELKVAASRCAAGTFPSSSSPPFPSAPSPPRHTPPPPLSSQLACASPAHLNDPFMLRPTPTPTPFIAQVRPSAHTGGTPGRACRPLADGELRMRDGCGRLPLLAGGHHHLPTAGGDSSDAACGREPHPGHVCARAPHG